MMRQSKAFTLIELLVVISIIALLSSITISSLNSSREKARVAAGKQFGGQVHRAFGAEAALIWDFDESSGNVLDISGNGNSGSFINGASRSADTLQGRGYSVSLNGSQYVNALDSVSLNVIGQLTLSAWIKPTVIGGDYKVIMAKRVSSNPTSYELYLGNNDGVLSYYNGTQYRSTYVPKTNAWTHVAATVNNGTLKLYADGKEVYSATGVSAPSATAGTFSVGVAGSYIAEYFVGYIDDVRVYTQSLVAQDIQSIYARGAGAFGLAVDSR